MRVHVLQFEENEYIGSMEPWFIARGYALARTRVYANEPLPTQDSFDWLIVMGGSMGVYETDKYAWIEPTKALIQSSVEGGKKVLGICLGGQLIASAMGAKVYANSEQEIGWFEIEKTDAIASWLPDKTPFLSWHGDCFELPKGAQAFAQSEVTPVQGFCMGPRVWALQFHLEANPQTPDVFLSASGGSIGEGPFIQDFEAIRNADQHIEQSQITMVALLEVLDAN